jgi:hypothetical protein
MPKTPAKRKNGNGKLTDKGAPHEASFARSAKLSKLPEVPLVVTPEAASCACASTSSIVTSTLRSPSTKSTNLSSEFAAESTTAIKTNSFSVVKKKAEYIDFCDSAQVKTECLKYIKTAADLPKDQQTQISFLVRKFNASGITVAFSMLIGKVSGVAPMAFFPLPPKKEDLI